MTDHLSTTEDEEFLASLQALRDALFGKPTEAEAEPEPTPGPHVPREGNNPTPGPTEDPAAFMSSLLNSGH